MKLAVLSDIHSNVFALEAVLADAYARGAERLLDLGDSLYGPIAPLATYALLQKHAVAGIRGNQDRLLYEASEKDRESNPTLRFVLADLGPAPMAWLRALPFDCQVTDAVYACHGSPSDDTAYLLENVATGFPRLRSDGEILASLGGQTSELILCGHTHLPRVVALSSGQCVANPGSVGLPAYADDAPVPHAMETYCPHASYTLVEHAKAGWTIQQIHVPYAHEQAAALAKERERADWAHALTTGRAWGAA